jgi:hypothetical protein
MSRIEYKLIYVKQNSTHLIKQVELLNPNSLIYIGFVLVAGHVKNCLPLYRMFNLGRVVIRLYRSTLTRPI